MKLRNYFGLLILYKVITNVSAAYQFKIIIVTDGTDDQLEYSRYLNFTATHIAKASSNNLEYTNLDITGGNEERTYHEICNSLDEGGTFILSLAQNKSVVSAVKRAALLSSVPTLQIRDEPWTYIHQDLNVTKNASDWNMTINEVPDRNKTNYITIITPTIVFFNILHDYVERINLTEATVLYDEIYKLDDTFTAMFSKVPIKHSFVPMETNETEIVKQISQLKKLNMKNIILMGSQIHLEKYLTLARNEDAKIFNWYMVTKDPATITCDNCQMQNTRWVRPNYDTSFIPFEELQNELFKSEDDKDLLKSIDKLMLAFYYDMVTLAWRTMVEINRTDEFGSDYGCYNYSYLSNTSAISFTEVIDSKPIEGPFGFYMFDPLNMFFQNVEGKITTITSGNDIKMMYLMGNWTITDGITNAYDSLEQDVEEIKNYRIAIVVQPPFIEYYPDGDKLYRGYCIDLIEEIRKDLNFNYSLYEVKDKLYGTMNERGEWNGLINELIQGHAQIALAPLSVMAERENVVDFTVPYYDLVGTTILMRKPEQDYSLFKFMTVLEPPVWGCIVGAYFFTSFLLWVFDKFSPYSYTNNKDKYKDDPEKREFTFKECLWFCMTSLTPQGGGEAPKNISGRLVAATWWLFGFIIIASYTANLAAFLTVSRLETQISSLDDLAKQYKIKYAPARGTASETYFKRMAEIEEKFYEIWKTMSLNESMSAQERAQLAVWDYPVSDKFTNMWRYMTEAGLPNSTEQAIKQVKESKVNEGTGFAFIGDATEIRYAELIDCELQMVGSEFSRKPYAIAVQQMHPLKDKISGSILKLLNQRKLEQLKENWWNKNPKKKNCPRLEDESDGISIQNIGGVFIVILIGIALSIVTLAFEYWYYKDKRRSPNGTENEEQKQGQQQDMANNNNFKDGANNISLGHFNSTFTPDRRD